MRLNRGTLLFIVALAIIIAAAVFLLRDDSSATNDDIEPTSAPQALFPDMAGDVVTGLTITRRLDESDETVTVDTTLTPVSVNLILDNTDNWSIQTETEDESAAGRETDQTRVAQAVSTLLGLRYLDSFESDSLEQFGLDDPAYTIVFAADGNDHQIQIGNKNMGGTQYYALIGDDGMVYLLTSTSSVDSITGLLTNLPYVIPPTPTPIPVLNAPGPVFAGFNAQNITSFIITDTETDEELRLFRDPESQEWQIEDSDVGVEQMLVNIVLSEFGALNAVDKVPGANLEALGLDDPAYLIVASINDDENFVVALGNTDLTGTRYYARVNDYTDVAVIESDPLNFILDMLESPPIVVPEVTPEATADPEATPEVEMTAEATEAAED